jgi:hypothetical protein
MKDNREEIYRFETKFYNTNFYKNSCEIHDVTREEIRFESVPRMNFGFEHSHHDETEKTFVENFANPLASVSRHNKLIVLEKDGDKISLKIFITNKWREVGRVWFKKTTALHFLTYNIKTNDFYDGTLINYHKKRAFSKKLRRNQLWRQPIARFSDLLRGAYFNGVEKKQVVNEIEKVLNLFLNNIPTFKNNFLLTPDELLFKTRCDIMGVKLPDNWQAFSRVFPTPTKKLLKKHNFKYIDAFQGSYGLTGDKFKKLFHTVDIVDTNKLTFAVDFFGAEFIRHQDYNTIKTLLEKNSYINYDYLKETLSNLKFTKQQIKNLWHLFILTCEETINYHTFWDHFETLVKLKQYGENIEFKAKNISTFNAEHAQFSELLQTYTKGTHYRFYNDDFTSRVQQPIFDGEYYYPVLLTTTTDYNNESSVQSNCVRGYVDKPSSLIISLRKGSADSQERATIEYNYYTQSFKLMVRNLQCLGRFNSRLPLEWDKVVRKLDDRLTLLVNSNVFTLPELITKFKNKEIYQKAIISTRGQINWDSQTEDDFDEIHLD